MPEPLFNRIPANELPEDLRAHRQHSIDRAGDGVRLEVFGHHPDIYRFYANTFYQTVFEGAGGTMRVDARWKELIRLKLSLTNGCFVCNANNVPAALASGYSQEQIDAMGDSSSPLFTPQEQAVLELGEQFAIREVDPRVSPELFGKLSKFFTEAEILELAFVATMLSGWTKMMFAFDMIKRECPIDDVQREARPSQVHAVSPAAA